MTLQLLAQQFTWFGATVYNGIKRLITWTLWTIVWTLGFPIPCFFGILLTIRLTVQLICHLLLLRLSKLLFGQRHRLINWHHTKQGYPSKWMILTCIVLSSHVVSIILGTGFNAVSTAPILPAFPYRSNIRSTKSLRKLIRSRPHLFEDKPAPTTPLSWDSIPGWARFDLYCASIPPVARFTLPCHYGKVFEYITDHPGASDIFLEISWICFPPIHQLPILVASLGAI